MKRGRLVTMLGLSDSEEIFPHRCRSLLVYVERVKGEGEEGEGEKKERPDERRGEEEEG
jgi:hypothetical protein